MLDAKVGLSILLSFSVGLDRSVIVAQLLLLLTHTLVCHNLDGNEVTELVVQAFQLLASLFAVDTLVLDLFAKAVAASSSEFQRLLGIQKGLIKLVHEAVAVCKVKICLGQR